jgi:hypothetical protein
MLIYSSKLRSFSAFFLAWPSLVEVHWQKTQDAAPEIAIQGRFSGQDAFIRTNDTKEG